VVQVFYLVVETTFDSSMIQPESCKKLSMKY